MKIIENVFGNPTFCMFAMPFVGTIGGQILPLSFTKPNATLLKELGAVVSAADELRDTLAKTNLLPNTFPKSEVEFWIDKLKSLPDGTASGCKEPLKYAQERLSDIGALHFKLPEERANSGSGLREHDDTLERGLMLDQSLSSLIVAISYARAELHRQEGSEQPPEDIDSFVVTDPKQSSGLTKIAYEAAGLQGEAAAFVSAIDRSGVSIDSKDADDLRRQSNDVETHLSLSRHALQQSEVKAQLLRRLGAAISGASKAAKGVWLGLRFTIDVGEIVVRHLGKASEEQVQMLFDRFRAFADDLERRVSQALRRVGPNPARPSPVAAEVFRDSDQPWCPELVAIPEGNFLMGSGSFDPSTNESEMPVHMRAVGQRFLMSRFPTTFQQFDIYCEEVGLEKLHDNYWGRVDRPVVNVTQREAEGYCDWLNMKTGQRYRLPSECEWEYCCRAGTNTAFYFGNSISNDDANVDEVFGKTTTVGSFAPNGFGLYDMHGNVWEKCQDDWSDDYKAAPYPSGLTALPGLANEG